MNGELDELMAQQMSGRAGRRGLDTQGNIVYAGIRSSFTRRLMVYMYVCMYVCKLVGSYIHTYMLLLFFQVGKITNITGKPFKEFSPVVHKRYTTIHTYIHTYVYIHTYIRTYVHTVRTQRYRDI